MAIEGERTEFPEEPGQTPEADPPPEAPGPRGNPEPDPEKVQDREEELDEIAGN